MNAALVVLSYDLLKKNAPQLHTFHLPARGDRVTETIRLAFDLDDSILPIQGPPGTGKTYIGSHMIAALARAGKRVGVTAVSHKVILNLLQTTLDNSHDDGVIRVAHKGDGA